MQLHSEHAVVVEWWIRVDPLALSYSSQAWMWWKLAPAELSLHCQHVDESVVDDEDDSSTQPSSCWGAASLTTQHRDECPGLAQWRTTDLYWSRSGTSIDQASASWEPNQIASVLLGLAVGIMMHTIVQHQPCSLTDDHKSCWLPQPCNWHVLVTDYRQHICVTGHSVDQRDLWFLQCTRRNRKVAVLTLGAHCTLYKNWSSGCHHIRRSAGQKLWRMDVYSCIRCTPFSLSMLVNSD